MSMTSDLIKSEKVLKLGQRMEFVVFGENDEYSSRLEDMDDNTLTVAMPFDSRRIPIIPEPGTKVLGKIVTKSCAYRFTSEYKGSGLQPIPIWKITRPPVLEKFQNREFVRIKISRPIIVRPINENGKQEAMVTTNTVDISGGGLCFVLFNPLEINTTVSVELANLPNIEYLKLMAKVVRCHGVDVGGIKVFHIGVQFLEMAKADQNKLIRYIFELQRKNLALGL